MQHPNVWCVAGIETLACIGTCQSHRPKEPINKHFSVLSIYIFRFSKAKYYFCGFAYRFPFHVAKILQKQVGCSAYLLLLRNFKFSFQVVKPMNGILHELIHTHLYAVCGNLTFFLLLLELFVQPLVCFQRVFH